MIKKRAVFDVAPLMEDHWTGISNVIAAISEKAMQDKDIDWIFCYEILPLPRVMMERLLGDQSGTRSWEMFTECATSGGSIDIRQAKHMDAIFPHVKPVRGYFRREALIVHDLSPLLTPSYHNKDNIDHFANRIKLDIESSEHYFCVSEATRRDVVAYFGCPVEKSSVVRLGGSFDPCDLSMAADSQRSGLSVEPYIVVLGTLEPRKNAAIVFDFLIENKNFTNDYKIVFVGRDGWLDEKKRILARLDDAGISDDRVVFTGFVTPEQRILLLSNCAFCIYPSFFEGFGLPILEAATVNKITVCSNTSSMPEVAPEKCIFFDPNSVEEFSEAMHLAHRQAVIERMSVATLDDMLRRNEKANWDSCYNDIANWIIGG